MTAIVDAHIEKIISEFDAEITNYEIFDLTELQGWSSKFLYLVISEDEDYILKGKTQEQMLGFTQEVRISEILRDNGFATRDAVKTKSGTEYYEDGGILWSLKTYISGSAAHLEEYTEKTVKTLATLMGRYITLGLNNEEMMSHVGVSKYNYERNDLFENISKQKDKLKVHIPNEVRAVIAWHAEFNQIIPKVFTKNGDNTLLHNDINTKNILIDHTTRKAITLIDWDHTAYGTPLKDICDTLNMFYDYVPSDKYIQFKDIFPKNLEKIYKTKLAQQELDLAQKYFYTISKWNAVMFYFDLMVKLGNSTNEEQRFINEIKLNAKTWVEFVGK